MKKNNQPIIHRGEVWYADLSPVIGSEQGGLRPVLIIQNDMGNLHSPTTIAAAITSRMSKKPLPTHLQVSAGEGGLKVDGVVLFEQIKCIDKQRLKVKMGQLSAKRMAEADKAIKISLGLV